jgi:hypothetical protein
MNTQISLARAAACLLLAAAGAQVHARQSAADPQAAVPATRYQSALDQRPEAAPKASPDANWVASNQTVAATNSMALTMKTMPAGQGQAADPHAGHAQHDHAAMQGMGTNMDKKDAPAMCAPGTGAGTGEKGMQCMSGDQAAEGRMSCCPSCCQSCCKDRMKKDKEAT